ncbi:VOC family protein [Microbacterium sp. RD1]|uniref:VOC family protein n=1 Tax=Microbacterium sp. RD1 TaxID=3457313 RepID=UPI003FA6086A
MTQTPLLRLYHTGIIVNDLDRAMAAMGDALGLQWCPPLTSTVPLRCPDGVVGREVRFTYSLQGPHHIELLEQIDPSPYLNVTGGRYVHHLGYFTDDLRSAAADLESRGYRMELSGVDEEDGGIARASFHYNDEAPGMWIELVSHEIAAQLGENLRLAAEAAGVPYVSPFELAGSEAR